MIGTTLHQHWQQQSRASGDGDNTGAWDNNCSRARLDGVHAAQPSRADSRHVVTPSYSYLVALGELQARAERRHRTRSVNVTWIAGAEFIAWVNAVSRVKLRTVA
jgi:hypothetical protein